MGEHYAAILGDRRRARSTCIACSHTRIRFRKECVEIFRRDQVIHWSCDHCRDRGKLAPDFATAFTAPLQRMVDSHV